jgi:CubicO group peptidase (beta-lactamase class C family)
LSPVVTMRDLVCACTGVPRRDLEFVFNADEVEPADVIASLASFEFFTPIGEAFQYSNQMVAVGGYLTTLAAGGMLPTLEDDYTAAMEDRVFGPLDMAHTTFSMDEVAANPNHASSHGRDYEGDVVVQPLAVEALLAPVAPSGTAWSNVDDMARYLTMELNDGVAPGGERVVSAANLHATWEPQVPVGDGLSYGLGWFVDSFKSQPMIQHAGNTIGFTSDLAFLPESDLGIVVLTNSALANLFTESVRYRALEIAFDLEPEGDEIIAFALEQQAEQRALGASVIGEAPAAATVEPFLGDYVSPAFGEVTLSYSGGRLLLDAGEFQGEVRPILPGADQVANYLMIEGPMIGLLLNLREEGGEPVFEVVDRVSLDVYPFEPVAGTVPVASSFLP